MISVGCKKQKEKEVSSEIKGNYFSVQQFALDEWNTFMGEPFMIVKTVNINGKIDSSWTNSDTISWGPILETFFETDISDRKFLEQYKFSQFDDKDDGTHNFFYEAIDEDLPTRKLLLTIDLYTSKVKGIYVETKHNDLFDEKVQKLYYAPMETIQIQTYEKPFFGEKKHTVVQWDFIR